MPKVMRRPSRKRNKRLGRLRFAGQVDRADQHHPEAYRRAPAAMAPRVPSRAATAQIIAFPSSRAQMPICLASARQLAEPWRRRREAREREEAIAFARAIAQCRAAIAERLPQHHPELSERQISMQFESPRFRAFADLLANDDAGSGVP